MKWNKANSEEFLGIKEGEDLGFMDTGTGRSVGIGLSVLWYRVIVQRETSSGYTAT